MPTTRPRATLLQPRHPRSFLVHLQQEVGNPDTWVLRPGSTDDSILKLVMDAESKTWAQQAEREMLGRVCPRSNDINTVGRQLGYYRFQKLDKTAVHTCEVEIAPGRTVSARYTQYTHVPHRDEAHSVWSNARGYPHKDHRRRTNHGLGSGDPVYLKRAATTCPDDPVRSPKKPCVENTEMQHTVEELLQDEDVVNDIIKQFEYVDGPDDDDDDNDDDILKAVDLNIDWTTVEALLY